MNEHVRERARKIVLEHGWNAASYQLVNDTIEKWFTDDAVVGFVTVGKWSVVAGPPVCSPTEFESTLDSWERHAGGRVCYFGAGTRFSSILRARSDLGMVALGSQPSWNPQTWCARTHSDASLRKQFNRARSKGVTIKEWDCHDAERSEALRSILTIWLSRRGLPPLHFLVVPHTLGFLQDRRVFVAERGGEPVAFLVLCPIGLRNGWLTEEFPRLPSAPNGTVELMMDTAVQTIASEGSSYVTMGLVPLAKTEEERLNPPWLRMATSWARAHGRRFYNFEGLERFKRKFHPEEWETISAVVPGREFSPSALYAVATAFSQQPAWKALAIGVGRAVKEELRSLAATRRH